MLATRPSTGGLSLCVPIPLWPARTLRTERGLCVDTSGAVDLSLLASEIEMPDGGLLASASIEQLADKHGYGMPPAMWARLQLTRLAAASVLEARLLHVKSSRLSVYGLVPDPEKVTLQQLAPLQLIHSGTAGQAFEIAVADAVIAGEPEVTGLIRTGLRLLNLAGDGPLGMVVLGMEKVPANRREAYWDDVRSVLPPESFFRTGMRGRPGNADAKIAQLAETTTRDLQRPRHGQSGGPAEHVALRDRYSQLGRADALVVCGSDLVAASLKINHLASRSEAWRDVPLWIVGGPEAGVERARDERLKSPRVTVTLPYQGWFAVFRDALEAVDLALREINRDRAIPEPPFPWSSSPRFTSNLLSPNTHMRIGSVVARTLWQLRREPIAEVTTELRRGVHQELREAAGDFEVGRDRVELTSLDVPIVVEGWQAESEEARVFVTQGHLFRNLHAGEVPLIR